MDKDVEGSEPSDNLEGSGWTPRHRCSRWDLRRPGEAYGSAAMVLVEGEEEPNGMTETLCTIGDPHRGRRCGGSL
jgi:hypothetical protein